MTDYLKILDEAKDLEYFRIRMDKGPFAKLKQMLAIWTAPAPQAWQPISTAPKDGTTILGYLPWLSGYFARADICPVKWSEWGGGTWDNANTGHHISGPVTHWMPLPPPPATGEKD